MSKVILQKPDLSYLNLSSVDAFYQLEVPELVEEALKNGEGTLTDNGALAIDTGEFTGRSPKDRYIVCDEITTDTVWWSEINIKISEKNYDALYHKVTEYLDHKKIYVRDVYACANDAYKTTIRVVTEKAFQSLFAHNMFLRMTADDFVKQPEWTIIAAPGFLANPETDGTRQGNFTILNFTKKVILIGGSGYTGEIKKGIFSVLNYILPQQRNVLSMHCSANIGHNGDTAIFLVFPEREKQRYLLILNGD